MIDFPLIWNSLPALFQGVMITVAIASVASVIGVTLGSILGLASATSSPLLRLLIALYVTFFRGTPMLIQILFIYYCLPELGVTIPPFWAATLALGLNSGAYISQIIVSGMNAVPKGQKEAAFCLGLTHIQTLRLIVFPQAFRIALPALGNEFVTLVKDSSLASVIGVMELSKEGSMIRSRTYDGFSILLAVSLIYLFLTALISFFKHEWLKGS